MRIAHKILAVVVAVCAPVAALSLSAIGATGIISGGASPLGALPTLATPTALATYPVSGLTAGAQAYVTNLGAFTLSPTCPTTCDGTVTCVTAAGVDGGMGCWTRGPIASCLCTAWTIDPVNGSDLAPPCGTLHTGAEFARRTAGCTSNVGAVVTVLSSLGVADYLVTEGIGPAGTGVYDCDPGAKVLYTSGDAGLTSATAHTGNVPLIIQDTAVGSWYDAGTLDGGGTTLVGNRIRITSGVRAGGVAWILDDIKDAGAAYISDMEIDVIPDGSPNNLTSVTPQAGDLYQVESVPVISAVSFGPVSSAGFRDNGKLIFRGCGFSNIFYDGTAGGNCPGGTTNCIYSFTHVPDFGGPHDFNHATNTVRFSSCHMGMLSGTATYTGDLWDDGAVTFTSGQTAAIMGGAIMGDFVIGAGADVLMTQDTLVYGGFLGNILFGHLEADGLGIMNESGGNSGIYVYQSGDIYATSAVGAAGLWGSGNGDRGIKSFSGSRITWRTTAPTVTGVNGDTTVASTNHPWADWVDAGAFVSGAYIGVRK